GETTGAEPETPATDGATPDATATTVQIDLDGIEYREMPFSVGEGRYGRISGVKGRAVFSIFQVEGTRHHDWYNATPPARGALDCYDFDAQKHERLVEGITDFEVGRDARTLLYRSALRLRVLRAGEKPPEPH